MSNLLKDCRPACTGLADNSPIELMIEAKEKDLGGFSVRRLLPTPEKRMVGPWIFFDHMGPASFTAGEGINVRPHPHINIATVTYLFAGEILHRDSLGNDMTITPGDINLMVAGKGIVHSERERPEVTSVPHTLHGLQLWLALPADSEEIDPAFYHYPSTDVPAVTVGGVPVRVMMGAAYEVASPVRVFADTLYIEAQLEAGQALPLPAAEERALYVADGEVSVDGVTVPRYAMAVLRPGVDVRLLARRASRIALIGGEPIGRRYMEWNFVSSRRERIEQAKSDWRDGRFPKVPGEEDEFIPLPEK